MNSTKISQNILNQASVILSKSETSLIICASQKQAEQVYLDLHFFWGENYQIALFPDWEILPFDEFSPHQDLISKRLSILYDLGLKQPKIIIASVNTLMYQLCPPDFLKQQLFQLAVNQVLPLQQFKRLLSEAQYQLVTEVMVHGDYAIRGALIDVFPMGAEYPIRIEWFDDEISSIRIFNPDTQRSERKIDTFTLFPTKEFPFDENARHLFRQQFRQEFSGNPLSIPIYEKVSNGQLLQGIENYLPLFFTQTSSFFQHLPPKSKVFFTEDLTAPLEQFWQEICNRHEQRAHDVSRPILAPDKLFFSPQAWLEAFWHHQPKMLSDAKTQADALPDLKIERQNTRPLYRLQEFIDKAPPLKILLFAPSPGKREVLNELCHASHLYPVLVQNIEEFERAESPLGLIHGPIQSAIFLKTSNILCISEQELMGESIAYQLREGQPKRKITLDKFIRDLSELQLGMLVVHQQFGIGRYEGMQRFEHQGIETEFLTLSYAGSDKIYVPVTNLQVISKYSGAQSEHIGLHKLGSDQWQKEKKKAIDKIHDIAIELLETQAQRHAEQGFACKIDMAEYERFASAFRFDETLDQQQSIAAILQDMQSSHPMDRLICGDVGFGKTEVAMRAAFVMAQNHKQVCVLVPTTLLAKQHFETFQERFVDFPISVELISRFRSKKDSDKILEKLSQGKIDILIGTHKLLQQNIHFHDLGLLIIDEEHRFGVKQKEHLKKIRHQADILSLTATPIPRTLNMAMHGLRDISLIATPPAKRLSIKTFWHEKNPSLTREAILREILRGGQVYYLHNDILSIEKTVLELRQLVPEASIEFAHGQMPERRLEQIMADFYHQRFNVLVCTTIIETGIDIPTANTMIIERADHLGLAQIHQLRGRVGRSHHQAYAYLLTPPQDSLSQDAIKRLEAIVSLENLGAGFTLAMHDMEIRGTGELLGEEQSGNMQSIGYSLYMDILEQAISDLKAGRIPKFDQQTSAIDIDLKISTIIPDEYIPDVNQRLVFYKRISMTTSKEALKEIQIELIDRFGLFPQPLKNLFAMMIIKQTLEQQGIVKLHLSNTMGVLEFGTQPNIDTLKLIQLVQKQPLIFKLRGQQLLEFKLDPEQNADARIAFINSLLQEWQI